MCSTVALVYLVLQIPNIILTVSSKNCWLLAKCESCLCLCSMLYAPLHFNLSLNYHLFLESTRSQLDLLKKIHFKRMLIISFLQPSLHQIIGRKFAYSQLYFIQVEKTSSTVSDCRQNGCLDNYCACQKDNCTVAPVSTWDDEISQIEKRS